MKIYKLKVVIELGTNSAFCDWYTVADTCVEAIDQVHALLITSLPPETEINITPSADMVFKNE